MKSNVNEKDTAEIFYKEVYKQHGIPRNIISGRGLGFTGSFWKDLMQTLKVKLNLSKAFHRKVVVN